MRFYITGPVEIVGTRADLCSTYLYGGRLRQQLDRDYDATKIPPAYEVTFQSGKRSPEDANGIPNLQERVGLQRPLRIHSYAQIAHLVVLNNAVF
jgi:hypothetical protein